jgi:5'-nucleotidase
MKTLMTRISLITLLLISCTLGYSQDTLIILHTNDTHSQLDPFMSKSEGNIGGVLRRYNFINQVRKQHSNVLILDAGDFSQGSPFYNFFSGSAEIQLMNMMGYDVVALGNHEFDKGSANLAKQLKKAEFKVVCANYTFKNRKLSQIVKPYVVIELNGQRVGVFGLTTNLKGLTSPKTENELIFHDPITTSKEMVAILQNKEHCDLIICLSHLGLDQIKPDDVSDKMVAEQVPGIDCIIGGHTHDYLSEPLIINNIIILQSGLKGMYVGKLEIHKK